MIIQIVQSNLNNLSKNTWNPGTFQAFDVSFLVSWLWHLWKSGYFFWIMVTNSWYDTIFLSFHRFPSKGMYSMNLISIGLSVFGLKHVVWLKKLESSLILGTKLSNVCFNASLKTIEISLGPVVDQWYYKVTPTLCKNWKKGANSLISLSIDILVNNLSIMVFPHALTQFTYLKPLVQPTKLVISSSLRPLITTQLIFKGAYP